VVGQVFPPHSDSWKIVLRGRLNATAEDQEQDTPSHVSKLNENEFGFEFEVRGLQVRGSRLGRLWLTGFYLV
jgi:hypothetical protein